MRSYTLVAPAKINLYLEIIGDRTDGYHELSMVLQSIDLADRVSIRASGIEQIRVHCQHPQVPSDQSNLAYRAANLMKTEFSDAFGRFGGVDISIEKAIPVGAGLAGGSTNAAAVLVGLDLIWQLGLTQIELQELGARLGSDVPFCITGGTALATGRGEVLSPLPSLSSVYVVLAKYKSLSVSTAWAYNIYREHYGSTYLTHGERETLHEHGRVRSLMSAIVEKQHTQVGKLLTNDLEKVVFPAYPNVEHLKETFISLGSLGAMMSGSGSTVFAIAESYEQATYLEQSVLTKVSDPDLETWVTKTSPAGIHLAT